MKSLIDIKDVSFSYGSTQVLSKISFSVNKGDFVGLIGQNGSGKTTLIKLLTGLNSLQSGSISILGKPVSQFTSWSSIGYVPQLSDFFSADFPSSVFEVVQTGLLSTKRFPRRFTSTDTALVVDTLKRVGAESLSSMRVGELSGGQQQRILIARALVTNPQLLILDEPTKGLDPQAQNSFYDLLSKLHKSGVTVLLVSHDVNRITRHVTSLAVLNTSLQFYGSHEEFCKHPDHDDTYHCLSIPSSCNESACSEECNVP